MDHVPSLVPDIYTEIYAWIKGDWETTVSWFFCCKAFHGMVQAATIRTHSTPVVTCNIGAYWDRPISRFATFQDKLGVIWRTMDHEDLKERDYPQDVWDKILSKTDDDWKDMETREYNITQEPVSNRLEWRVYTKCRYTFYARKENMAPVQLDLYDVNSFKNRYRAVAEFVEDVIQWNGHWK